MSSPESPAPVQPDSQRIEPRPVLPSGVEAGLVAGFVVALVFFIRDAATGSSFQTPAVLGTLLVEGADAARVVESAPGAAAIYHTLHFVLWVIVGGVGGWMLNRIEESPERWWLPWVGMVVLSVVCILIDGWAAGSGLPRLHLWLGSLAGFAALVLFFQWRHPHAMGLVRSFGKS